MQQLVRSYVTRFHLLKPGDRVGVAVSGGADSVALLRVLLELKAELGIVLSVVHFNHRLRGAESDEDERFVGDLASSHGVDLHRSEGETKRFAREKDLSIEAAARDLRYSFFGKLITEGRLDKIATAHTVDDQAETVFLRIFRGTGTSGLSGIHPRLVAGPAGRDWKGIVRPLLSTSRTAIEFYLRQKQQPWRSDSSNAETAFTRNRLRHEFLPLIKANFNPEIVESLSNLAEIARAEDSFWAAQTAEAFIRVHRNQHLDVAVLLELHEALQRRVLRLAAIQAGATIDFHHCERILGQLQKSHAQTELPNGFRAVVEHGTLRFESSEATAKPCGYSYTLPVPGKVDILELGITVYARVVTESDIRSRYNGGPGLAPDHIPTELQLRNWRSGDRFWPAHTRAAKKVKELLQERHLPAREKSLWPVAVAGDEIVWMRDFPVAAPFVATQGKAVVIESEPLVG